MPRRTKASEKGVICFGAAVYCYVHGAEPKAKHFYDLTDSFVLRGASKVKKLLPFGY